MSGVTEDRDELLDAVDLETLYTELVGPKLKGGWSCPNKNHAQTGATPPVSIKAHERRWHCFGCGAGGTAVDLLMLTLGLDLAGAFEELRRRTGKQRPAGRARPPRREPAPLAPAAREAALESFCNARGWDRTVVDFFQLSPVRDGAGGVRIQIPYRVNGQVHWWQDRALGTAEPKFLAPAGRKPIPYATDLARTLEHCHKTGHAVVLEGPLDLIAAGHAFDLHGVLALPGTRTIPVARWAKMLEGLHVVLLVDSDEAGEQLRAEADKVFPPGRLSHVRLPSPLIKDVDHLRQLVGCDDRAFAEAIAELFEVPLDDLTGA